MNSYNNTTKIALKIGALLIENGAEISRAEETAKRILKTKSNDYNVFCLNSIIIISNEKETHIKRIYQNELNLFEIDRLNAISRALCNNTNYSIKNQKYNIITKLLATILGTGSFCLYFGGSYIDAVISGIIGIVISYIPNMNLALFPRTFLQSALAGILAYLFNRAGLVCSPEKIMLGTIMLLVPGLTIGAAIRDIMYSDTLSGIIEITESLFLGFAIAIGFGLAVMLFGR